MNKSKWNPEVGTVELTVTLNEEEFIAFKDLEARLRPGLRDGNLMQAILECVTNYLDIMEEVNDEA